MKAITEIIANYQWLTDNLTKIGFFITFALITYLIFRFLAHYKHKRIKLWIKASKTYVDNFAFKIVSSNWWGFYIIIVLLAFRLFLSTNAPIDTFISRLIFVVITAIGLRICFDAINFSQTALTEHARITNEKAPSTLPLLGKLAKAVLIITAILLVLSNFGYNVNSLIAGLGIGGVAIAFAVQNILEDIFSSFSIYFDKPFQVGDFIRVDDKQGTVKKIGLKTTRIELLEGAQLVLSNKYLSESAVINEEKIKERRVAFKIDVASNTPLTKLKKVPTIIADIVNNTEKCYIGRVKLMELASYSNKFEIVYFVKSLDYLDYATAQQEINLGILEQFQKAKINIPFPYQEIKLVN